jgi:hypothetical protein
MTTYPAQWKMVNADKARDGEVIPLAINFGCHSEVCPNCGQEPPGEIFGWRVGQEMARIYYGDGRHYHHGDIVRAPCPVCGGSQKEYLWQSSGLRGKALDGVIASQISLSTFISQDGNQKALDAVKKFISGATNGSGPIPWLYIHGPNGCGKTHLMWSAINMLIKADRPAHYIVMKQMLDALRNSYDENNHQSTDEVRRRYIGCGILFIDEFEKDSWTDWASSEAFDILNERGLLNRPTMICSNLSLEELEFDKFRAMISRFQTGLVVPITGEDMRKSVGEWWDEPQDKN